MLRYWIWPTGLNVTGFSSTATQGNCASWQQPPQRWTSRHCGYDIILFPDDRSTGTGSQITRGSQPPFRGSVNDRPSARSSFYEMHTMWSIDILLFKRRAAVNISCCSFFTASGATIAKQTETIKINQQKYLYSYIVDLPCLKFWE